MANIFTVESNPDTAAGLTVYLEASGHSSRNFTDPADALEQLKRINSRANNDGRPDLVLTDNSKAGIDVLKLAKNMKIPVIMISGARGMKYKEDAKQQARANGVENIYETGGNIEVLSDLITTTLAASRAGGRTSP